MKIVKISITNLAAIEKAEIDFESAPLANEPLFLICGETGAGKSTILDAVCLALYDNMPRLLYAPNEDFTESLTATAKKSKAADAEDGQKRVEQITVKVNDTRNILRRGTGFGQAEVIFETDGDNRYKATWTVSRAHSKPNGKLQVRTRRLENLKTGDVTSSIDTCNKEIVNLIGLNFEQFTRTVLLAQNQFAKFLNANENEKSAILQMLTGVDVYSKISRKIFTKYNDIKNELTVLKKSASNVTLLSAEEIQNIENEISSLKNKFIELDGYKNQLKNNIQWLSDFERKQSAYTNSLADVSAVSEKYNSDETKIIKSLLTKYDTTSDVRQMVSKKLTAEKDLIAWKDKMQVCKEEFGRATALKNRLNLYIEKLKQDISELDIFIQKEDKNKSMYAETNTIVGLFNQIKDYNDTNEKYKKSIQLIHNELDDNYKLQDKSKQDTDELKQKLENANIVLNSKTEIVDSFDNKGVILKRTEFVNDNVLISEIKHHAADVALVCKNIEDATKKRNDLFKELNDLECKCVDLQAVERESKVALDVSKNLYDVQKLTTVEWVKEARASLKPGVACPVCGSTEHKYDENYELSSELLSKAKSCADEAQSTWIEANTNLQRTEARKIQCETEYNDIIISLENLQKDLENKKAKLSESLKTLEISDTDELEKISMELIARKDNNDKNISLLDAKLNEIQLLNTEIISLREKVKSKEKDYNDSMDKLQKISNNINEQENKINTNTSLIEQNSQNITANMSKLETLITLHDWKEQWAETKDAFVSNLIVNNNKWVESNNKLVKFNDDLQKYLSCYNSCEVMYNEIITLDSSIQNADINVDGSKKCSSLELQNMFASLKTNIETAQNQITKAHQDIDETEQSVNQFIADYSCENGELTYNEIFDLMKLSNEDVSSKRNYLMLLEKSLSEVETKVKVSVEELELHQQSKNKPSLEETPETLSEKLSAQEVDIATVNESRIKLETQLETNRNNIKQRQAVALELEAKSEEYGYWATLNDLFGSATGAKFRNIAQAFTLRFLLEKANYHLATLSDRYRLRCQTDSLSLLIEDNYSGGDVRPASTLSGGESFLVSLSLALGLSSLNDDRLRVDTLFIDEGFGTLSEDCLSVVMDALGRLQGQGRKVGIISHVAELRERIKVQIRVNRIDNVRSKIEVVSN